MEANGRAPAALPSENVPPVTVGWARIGSQNLFCRNEIIFLLPGIEPRFFGYQYETNSSHEAMCIVLCHVAAAYWPIVTKFI